MSTPSKKVENKHKYTVFQFIMLTLLITLIFYCTTHFSRNFFQIIKYTEIRFSGVLNPVLSIFYGFPAIIGCTIGNFLVDCTPTILNGTPMEDMKQNFLYLIPQFLYGFVPYFLWNHIFYKNKENKYRFQDTKKVILFTVTMVVASLVVAWGVYFTTIIPDLATLLRDIIFLNDAVACLLLGAPLLICMYKMHTKKDLFNVEKILIIAFIIELSIVIFLATRASLVLEAESLNKFYTICLCILIGITLIILPIVHSKKLS